MAMSNYEFYIDDVVLPITPPSVKIKVGNKNKTVDLANGGEMTIIKAPSLVEISFTARLPQIGVSGGVTRAPYLNEGARTADYYLKKIRDLKTNKSAFSFKILRRLPNGSSIFDTKMTMVVQDFNTKDEAEEGFDVLLDISLKQYIHYATKVYKPENKKNDTTARVEKKVVKATHVVKTGDTLWAIAKYYYGDGQLQGKIYDDNKLTIENEAKRRGRRSSSNGYWIYPGTKLTILERE